MVFLTDLKQAKFIDGKSSKFFDDLAVLEQDDGNTIIYITDVSRKFDLNMWCYTYLEPDPTGRILRYDVKNDSVSVILDHLCFPNGIEVSHDKQSILICELAKRRIIQHYVAGPKINCSRVFVDNLPGEPENIR